MLNYLYEKEMIEKLPFKVKQIKTDRTLPKFILPEEMDRIYQAIHDEQLYSVYKIYEITGMRLGELKQSHREGEFIVVEKAKNRKERIIPIPVENIPDYEKAKECQLTDSRISHIFSDVCREIGLKGKTLHCLRHTYALRKLLETNNISLVKELLGHCSVQVTEIYTQFPKEFLSQVFKYRQISQVKDYAKMIHA